MLWRKDKSFAPEGNRNSAVQPVACSYTDGAIPAPVELEWILKFTRLLLNPNVHYRVQKGPKIRILPGPYHTEWVFFTVRIMVSKKFPRL
jgi:hypothetical protein